MRKALIIASELLLSAVIVAIFANDLAGHVARYLDPKEKSQKVYQCIAEALAGRGMMKLI